MASDHEKRRVLDRMETYIEGLGNMIDPFPPGGPKAKIDVITEGMPATEADALKAAFKKMEAEFWEIKRSILTMGK